MPLVISQNQHPAKDRARCPTHGATCEVTAMGLMPRRAGLEAEPPRPHQDGLRLRRAGVPLSRPCYICSWTQLTKHSSSTKLESVAAPPGGSACAPPSIAGSSHLTEGVPPPAAPPLRGSARVDGTRLVRDGGEGSGGGWVRAVSCRGGTGVGVRKSAAPPAVAAGGSGRGASAARPNEFAVPAAMGRMRHFGGRTLSSRVVGEGRGVLGEIGGNAVQCECVWVLGVGCFMARYASPPLCLPD